MTRLIVRFHQFKSRFILTPKIVCASEFYNRYFQNYPNVQSASVKNRILFYDPLQCIFDFLNISTSLSVIRYKQTVVSQFTGFIQMCNPATLFFIMFVNI